MGRCQKKEAPKSLRVCKNANSASQEGLAVGAGKGCMQPFPKKGFDAQEELKQPFFKESSLFQTERCLSVRHLVCSRKLFDASYSIVLSLLTWLRLQVDTALRHGSYKELPGRFASRNYAVHGSSENATTPTVLCIWQELLEAA